MCRGLSPPSTCALPGAPTKSPPKRAVAESMPSTHVALVLFPEAYSASQKPYRGLPELTYPWHDRDVLVTACGRICMHRKRINLSTVLAGQRVGIKEVDEGIWIVSFMHYDRLHRGSPCSAARATSRSIHSSRLMGCMRSSVISHASCRRRVRCDKQWLLGTRAAACPIRGRQACNEYSVAPSGNGGLTSDGDVASSSPDSNASMSS